MSRITWTHDLRVSLYKRVIATLGHPSKVARGSRGKPIGMSKANYIDILESIGVAMGFGAGKGGALSNQIAWITCIPSAKCHQGHWNNRSKNIAAADKAGYFCTPNVGAVTPVTTDEPETVDVTVNGNKVGVCRRIWNSLVSIFK